MKLVIFAMTILLQLNTIFASENSDCDKFLGNGEVSLADLNKSRHKVSFGGQDLTITGSKVGIQTFERGLDKSQALVFENVRVYVSGVQNLFGLMPAHRLRGNHSALSELCSELTQGRLPYFWSDYNNQATGFLLPSRIVDLIYSQNGSYVDVSHRSVSTNVFSALICSEHKDSY